MALDSISGSELVNTVVYFAKLYIDIFIVTENMMRPLSQHDFFTKMQDFDMLLSRNRNGVGTIDLLLDILCYSAYGLCCNMFLKNKDLDDATIRFVTDKALKLYDNFEKKLSDFADCSPKNQCLLHLLRSYLYGDIALLHRLYTNNVGLFRNALDKSVKERKALYQTFISCYPENIFLATKLEQEYIVALSEQCPYMDSPLVKKMCEDLVTSKFSDWQKELIYTSSLTERIRQNIENLGEKE